MRCLRRRRPPAVLALIALALQLVLSLGHVHVDDDCTVSVHGSHALSGDTKTAAHHDPHTCSICLTLAILATTVEPAPPALPLPRLLPPARIDETAPERAIRRIALGFAARAPPSLA